MARIVLAGAGHCHVEVLRQAADLLDAGHSLTVISPDREHIYSGMAPGILAGSWSAAEASLPVAELAHRAGADFLQDRVVSLDPVGRTIQCALTGSHHYDLVSFNLGSETVVPAGLSGSIHPVKPTGNLAAVAALLQGERASGVRVAVVGGGFGGIEIAANVASLPGCRGGVSLYAHRFAPALPERSGRMNYLRRVMVERGVTLHLGEQVKAEELDADVVLLATGIVPPAVLGELNLPLSGDGALRVDEFLQVVGHQDIFAVGDCAEFTPAPLPRVGVFAVRQQAVLIHNLMVRAGGARQGHAAAEGLRRFTGTGPYLQGMNLGPGRGLLYRGPWTVTGPLAWRLKARIDHRFMGRYR